MIVKKQITVKILEAWLNYTRKSWHVLVGGYGVSTEHTAYLNLKHGIEAQNQVQ